MSDNYDNCDNMLKFAEYINYPKSIQKTNNIMKRLSLILLSVLGMFSSLQSVSAAKFNENTQYSRLIIESRIRDFYANTKQRGLNVFDQQGQQIASSAGELDFDYVPGLVAKAIIEATQYYSDQSWARPWFYSIESYANACAAKVPVRGGSLDDLNATKMYFGVYDLAKPGAPFSSIANPNTVANARMAMQRATEGLRLHDAKYSITKDILADAAGGWWHKKSYDNQMWLDGQYMGPALLAQLRSYGFSLTGDEKKDWNLITNQFTITWKYLWDADKQLLYHAFAAVPEAKTSVCWSDKSLYRSQEYWARAEGWYFLALVDVLEQMQNAGLAETTNFATLKGYLNEVAAGLARWQDKKTGLWYQLLAHDGKFYADTYQGKNYPKTYNYLESSASAIFIATYLKGMRLGLYTADYTPIAKKAYRGFIKEFVVSDNNGGIHLINCCRSAGLGGSNNRDGSAAYYLLGPDVTRTTAEMQQTEGKVLGAFILAATEYERLKAAGHTRK